VAEGDVAVHVAIETLTIGQHQAVSPGEHGELACNVDRPVACRFHTLSTLREPAPPSDRLATVAILPVRTANAKWPTGGAAFATTLQLVY